MTKQDLPNILYAAIKEMGGSAGIVEICKYIWDKYEAELKNSGDLFYTWQYDIRWAATSLRKARKMKGADLSPSGIWEVI